MLFKSFSKGPRGFPYVFIFTGKVTALEPVYGPLLLTMGSLSLGETSRFFYGAITFEVGLYTIPPTDIFNAFAETLGGLYYYITLGFNFLVTGWVPVVPLLLAPSLTSLNDLASLFCTLSKAHLGYLQLVSAFLRCPTYFWRSSGLLQTVLTLWVRVLMTLYLSDR